MIRVLSNQSVPDIAVQHAGSFEAAFALAEKSGISVTAEIEAGEELPEVPVQNRSVAAEYAQRGTKPATFDSDVALLGGIGFMSIDENFIVT